MTILRPLTVAILLLGASAAAAQVTLQVRPAGVDEVELIEQTDGTYAYLITKSDGSTQTLTPEEYAERLYVDYTSRPWYHTVLNVYSPIGIAWVVMGLLGQVLFTGRMVVQWLVSEKQKRSTVPVAFWWMSLVGATMLVAYFIWRRDIVGILGQSAGWLIYVRNLRLIYRTPPRVG